MRVLVTGHKGYLGSVVVPHLLTHGHHVVGLDTGLFADCVLGPDPDDPPGLELDLRDIAPDHLDGFDAVIHLAALPHEAPGSPDPDGTSEINHHAAVHLARCAKQAGVRRLLYASTCSVYGEGATLTDESTPPRPSTAYAVNAIAIENDLSALADSDFTPTFLRHATAFGFSPRMRTDNVVNHLVGWAMLTGEVPIHSGGTAWQPLTHVRDVASAYRCVLTAPEDRIRSAAYNVGAEWSNVTILQIAEAVTATVPDAILRFTDDAPRRAPRSYRVDFSAARSAFPDFVPTRSIDAGAREVYRHFALYGLTHHDFSHRFDRLAHLDHLVETGRVDATYRPRHGPHTTEPPRKGPG